MSKSDMDLLLIGKTGNGKSATGNSILGRKSFKSSPSLTSVTKKIQSDYCDYNDRVIKVVDGPGIGDTDLNKEDALTLVINEMTLAIAANPKGYHAFLLVVRLGVRFTDEDVQTIILLKKIFGEDFVSKYAILVMTAGDSYNPDETNVDSFKIWCATQKGQFQFLFTECKGRIVLFDNVTKDQAKIERQRDELINVVDNLSGGHLRYTDSNFQAAENLRNKALVDTKFPLIQEESTKEASLILQKLSKVQLGEPEKQRQILNSLHARAQNLLDSVKAQDKGTGALMGIIKNAHNIVKCVENQIESTEKAKKMQADREEERRKVEELRAEKEKMRLVNDQKRQDEIDLKIKQMEKNEDRYKAKIREMEQDLEKKTHEVHGEHMEAEDNSTWGTIKKIGATLFTTIAPVVLTFLGKFLLRRK